MSDISELIKLIKEINALNARVSRIEDRKEDFSEVIRRGVKDMSLFNRIKLFIFARKVDNDDAT